MAISSALTNTLPGSSGATIVGARQVFLDGGGDFRVDACLNTAPGLNTAPCLNTALFEGEGVQRRVANKCRFNTAAHARPVVQLLLADRLCRVPSAAVLSTSSVAIRMTLSAGVGIATSLV